MKSLNLSKNNIATVDACSLSSIQQSSLMRQLQPARIQLSDNPLDCDCDLFFLSRHMAYQVGPTTTTTYYCLAVY